MLKHTWYERGDEVRTVSDTKYCYFGMILVDESTDYSYGVDKEVIVRPTDEETLKRIEDIHKEGYKIYERKKRFRIPVFTEQTDKVLDDMLSELVSDLEGVEYNREEIYEKFLKELSEKFYVVMK